MKVLDLKTLKSVTGGESRGASAGVGLGLNLGVGAGLSTGKSGRSC